MIKKIITIISIMVFLTGCTGGYITGRGLDNAIEACKHNGGVKYIGSIMISNASDRYEVMCNNGLVIYGPSKSYGVE